MIESLDLLRDIRVYNVTVRQRLTVSGPFVGAVIDQCSPVGCLPVALVVGINYGQLGTSAGEIGKHAVKLGYDKHVRDIADQEKLASQHHVVLWNFYPFLTGKEWLKKTKNSAGEAAMIFDRGYVNPLEEFVRLEALLAPELIVFHGVTSAVPLLARMALRRTRRKGYLVNNLGRGRMGELRRIE